MADEVGSLEVKLSLDKSSFSSGLKSAESEAQSMGQRIEGKFGALGNAIGGALLTGAKVMASGAVIATGASIKWAADQEQAFMRVTKIMDMSADAQKKMKDSYRDLANTYGQSTVDIANAGADLAATGLFDTQEDLVKGTEALIKVNAAWGGQMQTTSKYLSQVATGYGLDADGMERWGSAVAVLADETGASEDQIARGAEAFVGLRQELGLSLDQVNGFTAAFAEIGTQPEEAKTQLKSMFDTFTGGSKQSIAAMAKLGVTTQMYDKAVREGKLPELFALVGQRLKGVTSEMERANMAGDLFGSYGRSMAAALPGMIDEYEKYAETSRRSYEENTRATEEANKALNTFYGQLNRTKNILVNFGAEIGDTMLKPLTDGLYTLNAVLLQAFSGDIPGAIQTLKTAIANFDLSGMIAGITSQLSGIGNTLLATFVDAMNRISGLDWGGIISRGVSAISGAMATIGNAIMSAPWGSWAQNGVSAFLAGLGGLSALGGNLVNWVTTAFNNIDMGSVRQTGANIGNMLIEGAKSIDIMGAIIGGITLLGSAGSVLVEFGAGIASAIYDSAKGWLQGKWDSLVSFGTTGISAAQSWGSALAAAVDAGFRLGINSLIGALEGVLNNVGGTLSGWIQKIPGQENFKFGTVSLPRVDATGASEKIEALKTKYNETLAGADKWITDTFIGGKNVGATGIPSVTGKSLQEMNLTPESAQVIASAMAKDLAAGVQPYNYFKTAAASGMTRDAAFSYYDANKGNVNAKYGYSEQQALKYYREGQKEYLAGNMYGPNYHGGTSSQSLLAGLGTESTPLVTKDVGVQTMISGPTAAIPSFYNWDPAASGAGTAGPTAAQQSAQKAYAEAKEDEYGILPNLKEFSSQLVKASAEGAGFCSAISEFGYMQEHEQGIFQESYIGPTSGWSGSQGGVDASQTATQVKNITVTGATQSKGITVGAAKDASGITVGTAYQTSAVQTQTQTQLNAQARLANDNKLAAEAATCGMWDEANARWTADSERMAQIQAENTTKVNVAAQDFKEKMGATGGKWEESSLNVTNGLTKWSEQHIANMNKFDENLNAHLNGTFTGMTAALSGGQVNYMSETMSAGGGGGAGAAQVANPYAIAYNASAKAISGALLQLTAMQKGTSDLGSFGYGKIGGQYGSAYSGWYTGGAGISNGSGWGAQASAAAQAGTASGLSGYSMRWFADGGIITRPSIVGVGEAGTEAIVPIGKLPEMMAQAMGGAGSGGGHSHAIYIDGKKIADAVGPAMVRRMQQGAGLKVR
jgi:TP901 family phage tail tape measure protein